MVVLSIFIFIQVKKYLSRPNTGNAIKCMRLDALYSSSSFSWLYNDFRILAATVTVLQLHDPPNPPSFRVFPNPSFYSLSNIQKVRL